MTAEIRRRRLADLEEGLAAFRTWWSADTTVECPYGDYRGVVALTYSASVDYPEEDLDRLHETIERRLREDPWSVADETRRHRDQCWSRYLDPPSSGEFGQDVVGAPVPGAGRSGTQPGGDRGPADETGGC